MKNLALTLTTTAALLGAGCTGVPVGTLNNQGAFGQSSFENQFVQISYATPDHVRDLAQAFANTVPTMVNFDFNQSVLDGEARRILTRQAEFIKRFPQVRFTVIGHTDLVGSRGYNRTLGQRRARSAMQYLISQGVEAKQLRAVASRGETQPLVSTPAPERLNRRTITTVTGYIQGRPGTGMDGKRALIVYNEFVGDTGSEVVAEQQ